MDILRVLSRGTKRDTKAANTAISATPKLPSDGVNANPQLFHDEVAGAKSRKRKRKRAAEETGTTEEVPEDIDFFAPKAPEVGPEIRRAANDEPEAKPKKLKLLDEDECRRILRSHRLKFTLLSRPQRQEEKSKVTKKKKKQEAAVADLKDDKKQLFPQPLTAFAQLRSGYGVSSQLYENLVAQGFRVPTEVQLGSLPLMLQPKAAVAKAEGLGDLALDNGLDLMAIAPTGSGKTITFLVPAINAAILRRSTSQDEDHHVLQAIVVAPTRELAHQIANEGRKLALGTGVRVVGMRKGMKLEATDAGGREDDEGSDGEMEDVEEQQEELGSSSAEDEPSSGTKSAVKPQARVDILVTTPKLLLNFLAGGPKSHRKQLPTVQSLILDEADVLLDPLFRKQTLGIWAACTNPDLNVSFWSATIASNVESLITTQLAKWTDRNGAAAKPFARLVVGLKDTAVPSITHKLIYTATEPGKLLALRQLLHPVSGSDSGPPLRPPFIVFTQTIERATALHEELKYDIPLEAGGSSRIAVLHSSLSDSHRSKIMARFRAGEVWILIVTDVLARGVDFKGVNGVVNYDVPSSAAAYVHRAGRTGRAGREGGVAVTFYTKDDIPFVKSVANVIAASEKQAGKAVEDADGVAVKQWLLDALPKVTKEDKRRLKVRGVEARRTGSKSRISTQSTWERRKEHNRQGAVEGSKRRKKLHSQEKRAAADASGAGDESEWGGLAD